MVNYYNKVCVDKVGNLVKRATSFFIMCGLFITCIALTSSNFKPDSEFEMILVQAAYGQMPGAGSGNSGLSGPPDPANPDAGLGGNSTNMDPGIGNDDNDITGANDTLGGNGMNNPNVAEQIANPYYNTTSAAVASSQANATVSQSAPEFGSISILVLAIAIVSTMLVVGKTRLRFEK
jgi:predicted secreted protein with PEFG-CTERM motif